MRKNSYTQRKIKYPVYIIFSFSVVLLVVTVGKSQFQDFFFKNSMSTAPHGACNTCHILHPSVSGQITLVAGNANLCMSCHNPVGAASTMPFTNAMIAVPGVSGSSHAWNTFAVNNSYEAVLPTTSELLSHLVNDTVVCSTCHDQHSQTYTPFLRASNAADALCKDCHAARNIMRYTDNSSNKGSHPVGITYPAADPWFFATPQNSMVLVNSKVECSSCHSVHNAASTDGYLLKQTNNNTLCTSCHKYSTHQGMGCKTCHQTHNTNKANIYLIKDNIQTPNSGVKAVSFVAETGANSFADGNATYNGVCEVCHTTVVFQRNNASGDHTHQAGANCMTCHPHSSNFSPPACNSCHTPGGAHNAHTVKYNYACSTCHYQRGSLTPYHVNGTNDVNFDPNGLATRSGADSNIPTWNSGNKTCSNIYCHSNGRTADRGQDTYYPDSANTYQWAGSIGPQTPVYSVTPSWTTGTISTCTPCHAGTGNMTSPYLISAPFSTVRPTSGAHGTMNHTDNDKSFSTYGWTNVQCFWCHNADGASANGPNYQGTYGTIYHVDGQTRFRPISYSNGGTMANGMIYSADGSQAHCGNGFSCW